MESIGESLDKNIVAGERKWSELDKHFIQCLKLYR